MKISEKNNSFIVTWSREKDGEVTWRKVKEYCEKEIAKIESSDEAKEIEHIKAVIKVLNHRVDLYNNKLARYRGMSATISLNDPRIDEPFKSNYE